MAQTHVLPTSIENILVTPKCDDLPFITLLATQTLPQTQTQTQPKKNPLGYLRSGGKQQLFTQSSV